jgi:hypothetical protein
LKLAPERSDRQIAKDVGVDHKTVGAVRRQGEERGEIPRAEKRVDTSGRSYAVIAPRGPDVRDALHEAFVGSEPLDIPAPPPTTTVASGVAGNATAADVEEARHRADEPYGVPPPKKPKMFLVDADKPHPKGRGTNTVPWVTTCPSCGHELHTNPRFDDAIDDFAALFNASVAGLPERVAA